MVIRQILPTIVHFLFCQHSKKNIWKTSSYTCNLEKHSVLTENQFGFRSNRDTCLAVVDVFDKVTEKLDAYNHFLGLFIDLSKAFNTLDHIGWTQVTTAFDSGYSLQAFSEVCRSCAVQATKCQYTESELYPLGDPQPMQVVEKQSDVIRPSRRENQPSCSIQNWLEPVKEMTGDTGQHRTGSVLPDAYEQRNIAKNWNMQ